MNRLLERPLADEGIVNFTDRSQPIEVALQENETRERIYLTDIKSLGV